MSSAAPHSDAGPLDPRSREGVVASFLQRYIEDQVNGRTRTAEEYEALFPGFEVIVARELRALLSGEAAPAGDASAVELPTDLQSFGRFRILAELGRGAQGIVYRAVDPALSDRPVALKILAGHPSLEESRRTRLLREAAVCAKLEDPGIATVFEVGEEGGIPFLAMQLVEGQTLAECLDPSAPLVETLSQFARLARSLHVAHEAGLIHRDIKPGNIVITPAGCPVLLDFGLARNLADGESTLTRSGELLGTPAYMAPEQIAARARTVDRRADVYALGVTLFECLTGRRPFKADSREALYHQILQVRAPDPRRFHQALPRDLVAVLEKALEKEPAQRYATALAFAEELERITEQRPVLARPTGPLGHARRWAARNRALAMTGAAALLFLVLGIAATTVSVQKARDETQALNAYLGRDQANQERVLMAIDSSRVEWLDYRAWKLWPATADKVVGMEEWLRDATEIAQRYPPGVNSPTEGGKQSSSPVPRRPGEVCSTVQALCEPRFGLIAQMELRLERARNSHKRSILQQQTAWIQAIASVAENPVYAGLELTPQLGLVPLGPDPTTKRQEFALLGSGAAPPRTAEGTLSKNKSSSLVLILVPPGPEQRPFFLARSSLQPVQWARLEFFDSEAAVPPLSELQNHDLRHHGLRLPTEAEWEFVQQGRVEAIHSLQPGNPPPEPPTSADLRVYPVRNLDP